MINFSEQDLLNENLSLFKSVHPRSNTLLVCFGGIKGKLPIPVFEFFNSLSEFEINKIFIRDFRQSWYHQGILHHSKNIEETLIFLKKLIENENVTKVIFLGNSAGGYAAILFGALLNVNEIIAFSPQTFLNKLNRFLKRDNRWEREIKNLYKSISSNNFLDLKKVLNSYNYNSNIHIYFASNHKLDTSHALHIKNCKNVFLFPIKDGSHEVIKHLRDNGDLKNIVYSKI